MLQDFGIADFVRALSIVNLSIVGTPARLDVTRPKRIPGPPRKECTHSKSCSESHNCQGRTFVAALVAPNGVGLLFICKSLVLLLRGLVELERFIRRYSLRSMKSVRESLGERMG